MGFKKSTHKKVSQCDNSQEEINVDMDEDENLEDNEQLENLMVRLEKFTSSLGKKLQGNKSTKFKMPNDPVAAIFQLLFGIQDSVELINEKFAKLSQRVSTLEDELRTSRKRETDYATVNKNLEDHIDDLEKIVRERQAVLSSSLIDSSAQNFLEKTRETIVTELGVAADRVENVQINKLGKTKSVILLTFPTHESKIDYFKRIQHRRKILHQHENAPPIYMNDFLTKRNAKLFKDVRKLKEDTGKLFSVFSFRGGVYVKVKKEDNMIPIRDVEDANRLVV